ncbi:pilus assembly PilX family protein [Sphaerotilus microaerophilus]|uniref:Type 4 fimbrial biogenesis protein PilX N-terminal domain-containing protein n=1 Tax=Sphaerotilus microaerophilus TaxID=2914710 RepID=A0ABM7YTS0_9BURK|nr:hypothetical protein [Sphaerotilus sp. FB-5]BDI08056.1 hypothetical protein CATMQ487_50260 [Sphaerotilus sp. FB-5]
MARPTRERRKPYPRGNQRGGALIVVIAVVLAIAITTLGAFGLARSQYQLAGNLQFLEQAFNQAEGAAASAENWLSVPGNAHSAGFDTYDPSGSPGMYPTGQLRQLGLDPKTMSWNSGNSLASGDGRYLIERMAQDRKLPGTSLQIGQRRSSGCASVDVFRVVARSNAIRGASRTIETTYVTPYC